MGRTTERNQWIRVVLFLSEHMHLRESSLTPLCSHSILKNYMSRALLSVRHCAKCFTQLPYSIGTIIISVKGGKTEAERLSNFPKTAQLVRGGAEV